MRAIIAIVVGATMLASTALASPTEQAVENKPAARAAFQNALRHYNLSEFSEALASFKEAYRNYPDPSFLFNIAQCHRQLGQKQDAVRSYRAYLREAPTVANRTEVEQLIASLEQSIREERATMSRPPTGAMSPGSPGPPAEATPTEPTTAPAPATTTPTEAAPAAAVEVHAAPPPKQDKPIYKKWWLWTAVGAVVVVGVGVGLGVGLSQQTTYSAVNAPGGTFRF